MTILVTGSTGTVGSQVVQQLANESRPGPRARTRPVESQGVCGCRAYAGRHDRRSFDACGAGGR